MVCSVFDPAELFFETLQHAPLVEIVRKPPKFSQTESILCHSMNDAFVF